MLLGGLAVALTVFHCTSNLEPYSPGVIIIISISNSTIRYTILLLPTLIQALPLINSAHGTYIHMINLKLNAIDSIWYSILWHQMGRSNNCSDMYNMHLIILLNSLDECINTSRPTMQCLYWVSNTTVHSWAGGCNIHFWVFLHHSEKSILFFHLPGALENGGSELVESSWSKIQEKKKVQLGRHYWGHILYTGPRWYKILAWSLGWHWDILPCNC